tara:strand:- start:120 stop:1787 length:1668 start_codon:yes stop_codon:yes gene_type:complete
MALNAEDRFIQSDEIIKNIEIDGEFQFDSRPDPTLLNMLRSLGYSFYEAVCDIIDNCFDAGADRVVVKMGRKDGKDYIIIGDNGSGMNGQILCSAVVLAGTEETPTKNGVHLGKFHMGLKTSILSMKDSFAVISSREDLNDKLLKTIYHPDSQIQNNDWSMGLFSTSQEELDEFNEFLDNPESGTTVKIQGQNMISSSEGGIKSQKNTLIKTIGRVYRRYLLAGKEIVVNGVNVEPFDPMFYRIPTEYNGKKHKSKIIGELEFKNIRYIDKDGKERRDGKLKYTSYHVYNPGDAQYAKKYGLNMENQGVYVMRNNREIMAGTFFDKPFKIIAKNPGFNYFRAELEFTTNLDSEVKLNLQKTKIEITQNIHSRIGNQIKSDVKVADKSYQDQKNKNFKGTDEEISDFHHQMEEHIKSKTGLLPTMMTKKPEVKPTTLGGTRPPRTRRPKTAKPKWKIVLDGSMGPRDSAVAGRMMDWSKYTIELRFNANHRFWTEHLSRQNPVNKFAMYSFLYAMYRAQFSNLDDDDYNVQLYSQIEVQIGMILDTILDGLRTPTK